jgi:hypothetical protein
MTEEAEKERSERQGDSLVFQKLGMIWKSWEIP